MNERLMWQDLGPINVRALGRLPLLHIPDVPGVYRILTENSCYIGQAKRLRHRIYEYHRPTQGLEHEQRLHRLLRDASAVRLHILIGADMDSASTRRAIELEAWKEAEAEGFDLLNVSRHPKKKQYEMLLSYHEAMAEEYRQLLLTLQRNAR